MLLEAVLHDLLSVTSLPLYPCAGRRLATPCCWKRSPSGWAERRRPAACSSPPLACCSRQALARFWPCEDAACGGCFKQQACLLSCYGAMFMLMLLCSFCAPLVQEAPGPGAAPRFASSAISNAQALPLLVSLLRKAASEDQLWGLAAVKELLLQGVHNLAAADGAALNSLLIEWLQEAVSAAPAGEAAAGEAGSGSAAGSEAGQDSEQHETQQLQARLLLHQLLAVLTLSGSYSIAGASHGSQCTTAMFAVGVCCGVWGLHAETMTPSTLPHSLSCPAD